MAMTVRRIGGSFVAEIEGVDVGRIDDAEWAALHDAYLEHKVLVLHDQVLTPAEFHTFGARFGEIEPHTVKMYHHAEFPGITILSNRTELGRPQGIRDAGSHWHSDYSYKRIPANATLLYALEIPDEGGDTLFCDLAAAWAAAPDELKRRCAGLRQIIQYRWSRDRSHPEARWNILSDDERAASPEITHPVIRTHPETGVPSPFVFPGITSGVKGFEGLDDDAADALKRDLLALCDRPEFIFRYKWRGPGDMVIWDNRCTMHQATTNVLPPDKFRTIHRINTRGTEPF